MKRYVKYGFPGVALICVVAVLSIIFLGGATSKSTGAPGFLVTSAQQMESRLAVSSPSTPGSSTINQAGGPKISGKTATYVQTTRGSANGLLAAMVDSPSIPVYFVKLVGNYNATGEASPPLGLNGKPIALPDGKFVHYVVDITTHQILDWNVSNRDLNLAKLGPVGSFSY